MLNRTASQIADRYIPATDRQVAATDNQPPAVAIASAAEAGLQISRFLRDVPVIETLEQARNAATQMRLGKTAIADLEIERTKSSLYITWKTFDERVKAANKLYKAAADPIAALVKALDGRLWKYKETEIERKRREAEEAQRKADELARRAQEIAAARDEAIEDAGMGVETDAGALIVEADQIEKRAALSATIAQGLANTADVVKIRDDFGGRATALRNPDVPVIADAVAAITAMGLTAKISEAIISSARDFHKAHQEWPAGITLVKQRSL